MSNARQVLYAIDAALRDLRDQIQGFEQRAENTSQNLVALQNQEAALYRQLAELRLEDLDDPDFPGRLSHVEQHVTQLLHERHDALETLRRETRETEALQTELEAKRDTMSATLAQQTQALEETEQTIHAQLEQQSDYQTLREETQTALDTLNAAEQKMLQAEQAREDKGRPFREDPLFQYLWKRRYGTSDYRANPIARFFDRLLARHIRYEANRQNYYLLLEIPKHLKEHTEKLREHTQSLLQSLADKERAFEEAQGLVPFETAVQDTTKQLAALDEQIQQAETHYQTLLEQRAGFTTAKDSYAQRAIAQLVEAFKAEPIPKLQQQAAQTEGYEDDTLVSQLAQLRQDETAVAASMRHHQDIHGKFTQRLQVLTDIRQRFKAYDFAAVNSHFSDPQGIELLLTEFTRGLLDAETLWASLERQQRFVRYRQRGPVGSLGLPPDFRLPGGIRFPDTQRFPRGIRLPGGLGRGGWGSRGGGGGGFHTGGGF